MMSTVGQNQRRMVIPSNTRNSSLDKLCDIPRCSVTKATLIDENRPFETWKDLVRDYLSWLLLIDLRPSFIVSFVPCI